MDDRLRALERAARADPTDRAAGWAFVRALDQAGEAFGAWAERCRLARSDDPQGWLELERPSADVREVGAIERRQLHADPLQVSVCGATLTIAQRRELLVLDVRDLSTRWIAGGGACALAHGPLVIHADDHERAVVVRDARDGRALGRRRLERDLLPRGVVAAADRAAVHCEREPGPGRPPGEEVTLVIDLASEPGATLAAHAEPPPTAGLVRGLRLVQGAGALEARDVVSDRRAHTLAPRWSWLSDEGGELLLSTSRSEGAELCLIDAATGHERWSTPAGVDAVEGAALTGDSVVLLAPDGTLVGRSRRTGLRRWTCPSPADGIDSSLAASVSAVYVASLARREALRQVTSVLAVDAATGRPLWVRDVAHPFDPDLEAPVSRVRVRACAAGVVVIAWGAGRVVVTRISSAAAP